MNNEQMTQEQRAQLIEKLHTEYKDLNGKIARLNAFLCDIDFIKKVPDIAEQELMEGQLRAMKTYLGNLRGHIVFLNEEQLTDGMAERLTNGYKNYCRAALEAYLERKITWWHLQRKILMPDLVEWVKACGQDANKDRYKIGLDVSYSVGDGSAVVKIPDSIKSLEGMQIIKVCAPKCKDCPCGDGLREYPSGRDASSCCKVELVGGYMLCLAPLPNSIITE